MTEVRYYTDEQVSRAVIRGLRQRGVDVTSVPEADKLGEEHLAFALAEGRVIFTQDDDFLRLAAGGKVHAGIVYAPQHIPVGRIIQGLMLIHALLTAEEMIGKVEFL